MSASQSSLQHNVHRVLDSYKSDKNRGSARKEKEANKRQKQMLMEDARSREVTCANNNLTAKAELTRARIDLVRMLKDEDGALLPADCDARSIRQGFLAQVLCMPWLHVDERVHVHLLHKACGHNECALAQTHSTWSSLWLAMSLARGRT